MLARRPLLLVAGGSGASFVAMGYSFTADAIRWFQYQAALLDPDAWVHSSGTSQSLTVPTGTTWFLGNSWNEKATGVGTTTYHRHPDIDRVRILPEGSTIETPSSASGTPFLYICKPELVVDEPTDDRYADYQNDPLGLIFERLNVLGQLSDVRQYGTTNTGSGTTTDTFDTDFDDAMCLGVSAHDVAWLILLDASDDGALNTNNEISDGGDSIRFAEKVLFPFKRTTFPKLMIQGSSKAEGRATMTLVPLPDGF